MKQKLLPGVDTCVDPKVAAEARYAVERGVRPMALVALIALDSDAIDQKKQAKSVLDRVPISYDNILSFVVERKDGYAWAGYASHEWVIDLFRYAINADEVPAICVHQIIGLLLGYDDRAIDAFTVQWRNELR